MTKNLLYLFLFLLICGFNHPDNKASWIVMQGSTLTVNGATNVNTFQCDISNYNMPDTISMLKGLPKGQLVPMNGKLNLEIEAFDCHNKMMTSDLRKTLKSKQFPMLSVKFISINGFPDFKNANRITGLVDIGLAGVSKRFEIIMYLVRMIKPFAISREINRSVSLILNWCLPVNWVVSSRPRMNCR